MEDCDESLSDTVFRLQRSNQANVCYACTCARTAKGIKSPSIKLTCANGGFALQRERLQTLLIGLQAELGQVLLDLAGHLGVLVELFGIQEGASPDALLVAARLRDVQHRCVGAALAQGTGRAQHSNTDDKDNGDTGETE